MALRDGLNVLNAKNEADAISDHVCLVLGAYGPGRLLVVPASNWRASGPALMGC